ncbi:peptide-methionine (S)-S-oxide reductase [Planomicrobium sp. YIM 101495]|uniref:peptide-methionine (S)-S-oxide reductase MsrA n=1 Tax=Planomicrobium sp. YIM 101495 TaxID=2665160 RepID=UPI0012B974FC|nr:peptide-methionine (S)-S-oxide reductase [Planomicrobium sp. YIM 101495]MTD31036.1 peptide methionine sulfoxide reductase [Planomicrobium sp. YIM 101495]
MTEKTIVEIEEPLSENLQAAEQAAFGMGCFWGPESRFGSLPGVLRTEVGFAGGTTSSPTYRKMGDHTETVHIEFDPEILSYAEVLKHFWRNHYPNRDEYKGRQYISMLHFYTAEQEAVIREVKAQMEQERGEPIETEIVPFRSFTPAEGRHQKYYLKRYPTALEQLGDLFPSAELLHDSIFAARLNGFVKGFGNREALLAEIDGWSLPDEDRQLLKNKLSEMKW